MSDKKKSWIESGFDLIKLHLPPEQVKAIIDRYNSQLKCPNCEKSRKEHRVVCAAHYHDYEECFDDDCFLCNLSRLKDKKV